MDGPDIPPFFICPISLQIMKDPVTLSTGMTYDRESIEKWLLTYNRDVCPVTRQALTDRSLIPNTTLFRLINSWCQDNSSKPASINQKHNPAFDASALAEIIDEVREPKSHSSQLKSLRKIRSLIQESDDNRRYLGEGSLPFLMASLINESDTLPTIEEAMNVLYLLKPSSEALKLIAEQSSGKIIESLSSLMQRGSYQARIHASLLLNLILKVVNHNYKARLKLDLFDGIVEILKDQNSNRATKAAMSILIELTPFGMNVIRAVEAGVVAVLVELLAEMNERQSCEIMLRVLEILCGRAEGRAAFVSHPASFAAVSSKILKVSPAASERAAKVLLQVCRFSVGGGVVQEMVDVGAVAKLCLLVQSQCSRKAREMALEILGLHSKTWTKSPCFPSNILI